MFGYKHGSYAGEQERYVSDGLGIHPLMLIGAGATYGVYKLFGAETRQLGPLAQSIANNIVTLENYQIPESVQPNTPQGQEVLAIGNEVAEMRRTLTETLKPWLPTCPPGASYDVAKKTCVSPDGSLHPPGTPGTSISLIIGSDAVYLQLKQIEAKVEQLRQRLSKALNRPAPGTAPMPTAEPDPTILGTILKYAAWGGGLYLAFRVGNALIDHYSSEYPRHKLPDYAR